MPSNAPTCRLIAALTIISAAPAAAASREPPSLIASNWTDAPDADGLVETTKTTIGQRLRDPESARYQWGRLARSYCIPEGWINRNKPVEYQWTFEFSVNAKNAYGAYIGYQGYVAHVDRAGLIRYQPGVMGDESHSNCHWVLASEVKPAS